MNINTIKTAINLIKNETIKFKLVDVETHSLRESDYETADSISTHNVKELKAKIVFDQPGYENFGFNIEKDISTVTLSHAEVDEMGINLNNRENSEPVTDVYYRGEVFSDSKFIDEIDTVLSYDLLVGEDSLFKDIEFNEDEKVSLNRYALCLLDAPLDDYLRKEHNISFESLLKVIKKLDDMEPEAKLQIFKDNSDESLHELYKAFKACNNKQKDALKFSFLS